MAETDFFCEQCKCVVDYTHEHSDTELSPSIEERIKYIETILHANGMHEPTCPMLVTQQAQKNTEMYLKPKTCDCWLSKE